MVKRLKQWFCNHRFYLDHLGERDDCGMVHAPCYKCGKVCAADCGLHLPGGLMGWSPEETERKRQLFNGS